jgi:predicted KAP-like P-loop ATPase
MFIYALNAENRVKNYLARFIFVTCSLIEILLKDIINAYSRNNCMNGGGG